MKQQFFPAEMLLDENLRSARISAAMDFLLEVENDLWRRHVLREHSADWPWRQTEGVALQLGS